MLSVIVIGGDHHNTLGVVRALGYKGVKPFVIIVGHKKNSFVLKSKYVGEKKKLENKLDIVPFLLEGKKPGTKKCIVISCADFVTSELDIHKDELSNYYILPVARDQGEINNIMRKDVMAEVAVRNGLNVPQSWIIGEGERTTSIDVEYPCIVKPVASIEGAKADIAILQNKEELESYMHKASNHRILVQQYINKDYEYQLIGCSIDGGRDIIIPGISKCIRPCPRTNTGFLEYLPMEKFSCDIESCYHYIREIGYSGLFSMEFLRDKSGKDFFIEINMRNDGNAICVTGAGVNLPYIWYLACQNMDYKYEKCRKIKNIFVMPEIDDFHNFVLTGKISMIQWIRDHKKTSIYMEYDKSDPKPSILLWIMYLKNYRNILSTLLRKRWHILKEQR